MKLNLFPDDDSVSLSLPETYVIFNPDLIAMAKMLVGTRVKKQELEEWLISTGRLHSEEEAMKSPDAHIKRFYELGELEEIKKWKVTVE